MSYNLELFGQKLRAIRKSLHISKSEIENKAGISSKTIVRLENAKSLPCLASFPFVQNISSQLAT